jgi:hypothetical protein
MAMPFGQAEKKPTAIFPCRRIVFTNFKGFSQKSEKLYRRHAQCLEEFDGGKQFFGWVGQGLFSVEEHDARACRVCPQTKLRRRR